MLKNVGISRQTISKKETIPKLNRLPINRTPDMISKVKRLVDRKNPASHRHIQSKKKQHLLFILLIKSFIRICQKILEKNRKFIILMKGKSKTGKTVATSYMRST